MRSGKLYVERFTIGSGVRFRVCYGSVEIKTFFYRDQAEAYIASVRSSVRVA